MIKIKFKTLICSLLITTPLLSNAQDKKTPSAQLDSLSYSLGVYLADNIKAIGIDSFDTGMFLQGIEDFKKSDTLWGKTTSDKYIKAYRQMVKDKKNQENLDKNLLFLENNKKQKGVQVMENGLQYIVIKEGKGDYPQIKDKVSLHYIGTLIDGTVFGGSNDPKYKVLSEVDNLFTGWKQSVLKMKVGSKWKIFIPPALGAGDQQAGKVPPNSVLIVEMELLGIE